MIRTDLAAAAAVFRIGHQIVAEIVVTEGFSRAVNAFPIRANTGFTAAVSAFPAVFLFIFDVGAIAAAWLHSLSAGQRAVRIVRRTCTKTIQTDLFFAAGMSAVAAIRAVLQNIDTDMIADDLVPLRTRIDA